MKITMHDADRASLDQMREFLEGSREIRCEMASRGARYALIVAVLKRQRYRELPRTAMSVVRRYLEKLTGFRRAQMTRLIARWRRRGDLTLPQVERPRFARRYTVEDIARLARVDEAHQGLSGPATRRILWREYAVYGHREYQRLAEISVAHLYRLRSTETYRRRRLVVEHTRSVARRFGERRKPEPQGRPGYLRIDTVHQGQQDGRPGPYHINSVDTVTQWEIVGSSEELTQEALAPLLGSMLEQYPFRILGMHADNGSEYQNRVVARLLNAMLIEFTKSRSYRTTDNALVEGKNGAVVRKMMGYGLYRRQAARPINDFFRQHLNPYLNFHRPCGFAQVQVNERGKRRRFYPAGDYRTPYEKLMSLPDWQQYLKPGISPESLARQAAARSDTEAAIELQQARQKLYEQAISNSRADGPEVSPLLTGGKGAAGCPLPPDPHPPPGRTGRKEKPPSP